MSDEELLQLVRQAIMAGQDGEEWDVQDGQGNGVFEFHHRLDSFRLDPSGMRSGTNELARMRLLHIVPGREEWVNHQMLRRCEDGRLAANGYYLQPVNPSDPLAVLELVRWMIGHCAPEHSTPAVRNMLTGEWIIR